MRSNARDFKRAIDCLRDVVRELTFQTTAAGLRAHAVGDGILLTADFGHAFDAPCTFGLSADALSRLVRTATPAQKVALSLEGHDVRCELFTDTCASRFTLATLDVPTPRVPPPVEREPTCTVKLRTDHLRALLRNLRHVESLSIALADGALVVHGASDHSSGEVVTTEIDYVGAPGAFGVYPNSSLQHFLKSQHLASAITLAFWPDQMRLTLAGAITLALTLKKK